MPTGSSLDTDNWRNFAQVDARRSFILMALGALAGLLLSGYALFTARGTSTLRVPAEDVALVNQRPISRLDFLAQLQTLYGVDLSQATAAQRNTVLDGMIREELFVQRGQELDVASTDPEVRSALVNAVEAEIAEDAITSKPSDSALSAYYSAHPERYTSEGVMNLKDWVIPVRAAGAVTAARWRTADQLTPSVIESLHGKDSGSVRDDEFYFAAKIHLGERLFDAARRLSDGQLSAPIEMPDGIHLLAMQKNTRPIRRDFSAARDQVLSDYRNDSIARLKRGDESYLRRRATILIADDLR